MNTILAAAAAVTGARHHRAAHNGQDAAATWVGDGAGAVVVCDGCGAGDSSEVGARLGAQLVIGAVAARLRGGERPRALWSGVREQVVATLGHLVEAMPVDRAAAIHDYFLFTIVAAAVAGDEACVWAIGDGAYVFSPCESPSAIPSASRMGGPDRPDRSCVPDRPSALPPVIAPPGMRVLGPFADNQPPYLGYDLLGMPATAHVEAWHARAGQIVVATDGVMDLALDGLLDGRDPRLLGHPDGLRRWLAVRARGGERIDWDARRVDRTPAALQDDGAVAVLGWAP